MGAGVQAGVAGREVGSTAGRESGIIRVHSSPPHSPPQSIFDAKGMAGNIIHAIATTNAVVSGLIVIEALKVLAGE